MAKPAKKTEKPADRWGPVMLDGPPDVSAGMDELNLGRLTLNSARRQFLRKCVAGKKTS